MNYSQWAQDDDGSFVPVADTVARIAPGYYDTVMDGSGRLHFMSIRARKDDLLEFPDSASMQVIEGIRDFWDQEEMFKRYGLPYKRGILLYGPPGSGKTCTMQIVARDVVAKGGVVVTFDPRWFLLSYRAFRDIQPETPMVVLMEDCEDYLTGGYASMVLNLLDGGEQLHRVVFLASTNYPERLEGRVINRPSRFDLRIKVPTPSDAARRRYLESLLKDEDSIDIDAYVRDTKGLSLAHVKELFVACHILGSDYKEAASRLAKMAVEKVSSDQDDYDDEGDYGMQDLAAPGLPAIKVGEYL